MHVGEHTLGVVSFSTTDGEGVEMPHDNALVIEAIIHNFSVRNIFLDDGANLVEVSEIYIYTAFTIRFHYMYRGCQPLKVFYLHNKPSLYQFFTL